MHRNMLMPGCSFELAYCTSYNASTIVRHSSAKRRALRQTTTTIQPASLGIRLPQSSWKFHSRRSVTLSAAQAADQSAGATHTAKFAVYGARKDLCIKYKFVSRDDPNLTSEEYKIEEAFRNHGEVDETGEARCEHAGPVTLPQGFVPGAVLVSKEKSAQRYHIYLSDLDLVENSSQKILASYCVGSNIATEQGWRPFFPDTLTLPAFKDGTPKGIQGFRSDELAAVKGTSSQQSTERKEAERIYGFDVYNDLGSTTEAAKKRPTLGGDAHKYPRRLRTGRALENGLEVNPPKGSLPWLPPDERFNAVKFRGSSLRADVEFQEGAVSSASMAVRSVVRGILGTPRGYSFLLTLKPFLEKMQKSKIFKNFAIYDSLYKPLKESEVDTRAELRELLPLSGLNEEQLLIELKDVKIDSSLQQAFLLGKDPEPVNALIQEKIDAVKSSKEGAEADAPKPKAKWNLFGGWRKEKDEDNPEFDDLEDEKAKNSIKQNIDVVVRVIKSFLELWPSPRSRFGRALEWRSDEDFARSFLAGQNPLSIRAVTPEDLKTFAVATQETEQKRINMKGLLEGSTLEQAVENKRLFVVDFHPGYIDFVDRVAALNPDLKKRVADPAEGKNKSSTSDANAEEKTDAVLYAGRCVFYLKNHGPLVPVSIELETAGQSMRVYTPNNLSEVWFMAKTVIASLDSGVHQLISHWLTTHACVEPYVISTHRELSIVSPLYKLLEPHFRYTLRINCNARAALISAGGIIESCFSPGKFSMELSSNVYASWRFDQQSFPADLLHRGMAEKNGNELKMLLDDYPYAEDGLLIWNAILKFATDYLSLYYDDHTEGRRVTDDVEVMNWWKSVQQEGHPDIKQGWPEIKGVKSLADVAATIMWTASAHHAAVNFGQYDNAAYMPYRPSKIRRIIPTPGSPNESFLRDRFEEEFFSTVSDTISSMLVMATVQILSAHASDEEYLDKSEHKYIKDEQGRKVHEQFLKELQAAEGLIKARNDDQDRRIRQGRGMRYTLLIPSIGGDNVHPTSERRPPARGIPYSISI